MLDFDEIKKDISDIIAIGDEALASTRLIELQDKIVNEVSETSAEIKGLNDTISDLNTKLESANAENESIRKNNKDLLLRYGELVTKTQPAVSTVETEESEEEKLSKLSWNDIAKME